MSRGPAGGWPLRIRKACRENQRGGRQLHGAGTQPPGAPVAMVEFWKISARDVRPADEPNCLASWMFVGTLLTLTEAMPSRAPTSSGEPFRSMLPNSRQPTASVVPPSAVPAHDGGLLPQVPVPVPVLLVPVPTHQPSGRMCGPIFVFTKAMWSV